MTCCLVGTKPLAEPAVTPLSIEPLGIIFKPRKFESNQIIFCRNVQLKIEKLKISVANELI